MCIILRMETILNRNIQGTGRLCIWRISDVDDWEIRRECRESVRRKDWLMETIEKADDFEIK